MEKAMFLAFAALALLGAVSELGESVSDNLETVSEAMATDSDCRGLGAFKCQ